MHSRVVGESKRSRALPGSFLHQNFTRLRSANRTTNFTFCLLKSRACGLGFDWNFTRWRSVNRTTNFSSSTRACRLLHQFVGPCAHLHRTGRRGAESEELWKRAAPPPFCVAAREHRGIPLYLATKLRQTPAHVNTKLMTMQLQTSEVCGTRLSEKHK